MWILFLYPFSPANPSFPTRLPVCRCFERALSGTQSGTADAVPFKEVSYLRGRETRWRLIAAPDVHLSWRLVSRLCLRPNRVSKKRSAGTTYPFNIVRSAPRAPPAASAHGWAPQRLVSPTTGEEFKIDARRHPLARTLSPPSVAVWIAGN